MSNSGDWAEKYLRELASDKRSFEELVDVALVDLDSSEAGTAISVIHHRGTTAEFHAGAQLCRDTEPNRRAVGAWILGQLGSPPGFVEESVDVLIPMLDDKAPIVAAFAASALGSRRDAKGIGPLVAHTDHWDSEVRRSIAAALGDFSEPEATEALITLSRDEAVPVRDWATFGLGVREDVDTWEVREALAARLDDEDSEVRGEAMIGLAVRGDRRAIGAIRAELLLEELDGDWVFEAAERMEDSDLYEDLQRFVETHPEWAEEKPMNGYLKAALKACRPKRR
jgi:HEAT repeat protein